MTSVLAKCDRVGVFSNDRTQSPGRELTSLSHEMACFLFYLDFLYFPLAIYSKDIYCFYLFNFLSFLFYVYVRLHVCMFMHVCAGAHRSQKSMSDLLELE